MQPAGCAQDRRIASARSSSRNVCIRCNANVVARMKARRAGGLADGGRRSIGERRRELLKGRVEQQERGRVGREAGWKGENGERWT